MANNDSQVIDINEKYLFSLSQLSSVYGPARETISKRLRSADISPTGMRNGHPVYHIGLASKAILAGEEPTFEEITDPSRLPPKARLDYYKSENEKRKFEQEAGLLVPVDDVRAEYSKLVKILIRTLDGLSDHLEMKCGLSTSEIQLVEDECDKAREELATRLAE